MAQVSGLILVAFLLCSESGCSPVFNPARECFSPFGQKPLDICVQVHGVWCQEASQALQNGTEEAITRGRGKRLPLFFFFFFQRSDGRSFVQPLTYILLCLQKEQKKKEDSGGRGKNFRPEPCGSSRDSTGTQSSSKPGSHSSQTGPHGHHREPYNSANKRHFGNDGT